MTSSDASLFLFVFIELVKKLKGTDFFEISIILLKYFLFDLLKNTEFKQYEIFVYWIKWTKEQIEKYEIKEHIFASVRIFYSVLLGT